MPGNQDQPGHPAAGAHNRPELPAALDAGQHDQIRLRPGTVGMAWYARENYDAIRRLMADGHQFARTFEEWQRDAQRLEHQLRRDGFVVVRAFINPGLFAAWCKVHALGANAAARKKFANFIAREQAAREGR